MSEKHCQIEKKLMCVCACACTERERESMHAQVFKCGKKLKISENWWILAKGIGEFLISFLKFFCKFQIISK